MLLSNNDIISNYSIISSKNDVMLYKSKKDSNTYRISFNIDIPENIRNNIKPNKYINLDLYHLLEELNKDVIEKIDIIQNENEIDTYFILFRFNHLGKEFGMKKKFMLSSIKFIQTNNDNYSGITSQHSKIENLDLTDYDEIISEHSNLLSFRYEKGIGVHYDFKLQLMQELPSSMKDFGALLMKKIFIRIRDYILQDIKN